MSYGKRDSMTHGEDNACKSSFQAALYLKLSNSWLHLLAHNKKN